MSSILDSRTEIQKLDQDNLLGSVESLPDQIQDAWRQTESLTFPDNYPSVKNIVVSGMGGSNLGAQVIKHLYKTQLSLPIEICAHYDLPGYVNKDTLVVLSSYSGNTEETLSCAKQAQTLGTKICVITGGGGLERLAQIHHWPMYLIDPKYNPCGAPRMAIGYAVFGTIAMFAKMGLLNLSSEDILNLVDKLRELVKKLAPEVVDGNAAKLLAYAAYDKHIIFTSAEHLVGATHVFNNQINENAKTLTTEWPLPEFDHHFLEALSYPQFTKENTIFFLIGSALYHDRVQKRFPLTQATIESKGYEVQMIQASAPTRLEQVFEIITLGEFVALYLPLLYGINPSSIPNVKTFKTSLA
jgi:glucose/mannose-6-phosphate isomerase